MGGRLMRPSGSTLSLGRRETGKAYETEENGYRGKEAATKKE